jgi:D-glycero-alpha-D-manno-heptose 1-phosphate guanylyltransferase
MECIVLAGGLGTRLQGVIGAQPKCMAPVAGVPFLQHLFHYLAAQQCSRVILSLGFRHEVVTEWLPLHNWSFAIDYVIEETPLGTGGGISLAMTKAQAEDVAVINGDTMFRVDLAGMMAFHLQHEAATTLALKEMQHFERYGVVRTNEQDLITSFEEKQYRDHGWINGGIYIIHKAALAARQLPQKYSFEKDYLETIVAEAKLYGYPSQAYFIDIGVPEDYAQAQSDFKQPIANR